MLMMIFLLLILMKLKCKAAKKQLWEVKTKVHTFFNALIISNEHFIVEHWIEWWGRKEKTTKKCQNQFAHHTFSQLIFFPHLAQQLKWNYKICDRQDHKFMHKSSISKRNIQSIMLTLSPWHQAWKLNRSAQNNNYNATAAQVSR